MTISAALNSALSGLAANGRASGIVSGNIANALTPGYAKRSLELTSNAISGHGVQVIGISRRFDPVLTANRQSAEAASTNAAAIHRFQSGVESLIGPADNPASLPNRLAAFESALITAASNPSSASRLDATADAASQLADAIRSAGAGLRDLRSDADRRIGQQVEQLNTALAQVETLNAQIQSVRISGGDTASLLDQRSQVLDRINAIVPVRTATREHGQIALYSEGGAILLDGTAARLSFSGVRSVEPHMTVSNGLLSGLQINGIDVRTGGDNSGIRGGALAAEFEIRDELAIEAQKDLDALTRDLIERFADPTVDPTLAPGDPGLFTDQGAAFDPLNQTGLANRLELNAAIDPAQAGESWRLRDGLNAATPGPVGNAALIQSMGAALSTAHALSTPRFGSGAMSAADVAAAALSKASQHSASAEVTATFAASTLTEMQKAELALGVDTDEELQSLMKIEQAYAANARVLQVVGELMDTLLRI